jgi:hypothetical protein
VTAPQLLRWGIGYQLEAPLAASFFERFAMIIEEEEARMSANVTALKTATAESADDILLEEVD